jgi:hypothetical protein
MMKSPHLEWVWTPCVSVGPFLFDKKFNPHDIGFAMTKISNKEEDWTSYDILEDGARISVDSHGNIVSIECAKFFIFKGLNFVGSDVSDIEKYISCKFEIIDHSELGREFVGKELGIILWEEHGVITSVTASSGY